MSQGKRYQFDPRLYQNQWEFIDQIGFLKGFQRNIPKFLMGFGHGGLIATRLVQERNDYFSGAILVNPCYTLPTKLSGFNQNLLRAKSLISPDETYTFTYPKDLQQLYDFMAKKEPLYNFEWNLKHLIWTIDEQAEALKSMPNVQTPTLMILSDKDRVTDSGVSKKAFIDINTTDKKL